MRKGTSAQGKNTHTTRKGTRGWALLAATRAHLFRDAGSSVNQQARGPVLEAQWASAAVFCFPCFPASGAAYPLHH